MQLYRDFRNIPSLTHDLCSNVSLNSYDYSSGSSSYTKSYRTSRYSAGFIVIIVTVVVVTALVETNECNPLGRSDDILSDPFYTKTSSVKNTYASPDR